MRKETKNKIIRTVLFVSAALFALAFAWLLCRDYYVLYPYGSAPFSLYVIERAAEFLIPAAACLTVGLIVKKRRNDAE